MNCYIHAAKLYMQNDELMNRMCFWALACQLCKKYAKIKYALRMFVRHENMLQWRQLKTLKARILGTTLWKKYKATATHLANWCADERGTLPEYLLQGDDLRCITTCGRHQEVPAGWQGGAVEHDSYTYVRGTPAVRNACQENSLLVEGALREGSADFWNHASMNPPKEYLLHLQPPRRERTYVNRPWILGIWRQANPSPYPFVFKIMTYVSHER